MDIPQEAIEMTYERVEAKRGLGTGRWDMALKKNLTELSQADNYEEAKHEWVATGNVWWRTYLRDGTAVTTEPTPAWVANSMQGEGKCLCGHIVVYHFEIQNTVTGELECVGSDHINTYLIIRAIKNETGLSEEHITDAMIEEWINVRVEGLKKDAWWEMHGAMFTHKFERIRELDLRINVRVKGTYFDHATNMYRPKTYLRKRRMEEGMASIVWRWNHPDNSRAQINGKGYPNAQLLEDLDEFYYDMRANKRIVEEEDRTTEAMIEAARLERERKRDEANDHRMAFFGFNNYTERKKLLPAWEKQFLSSIENQLRGNDWGHAITPKQMEKLIEVLEPATEKQLNYMRDLGYDGSDQVTKRAASHWLKNRMA